MEGVRKQIQVPFHPVTVHFQTVDKRKNLQISMAPGDVAYIS
jgi:hypothetical protein